ncbi:MAG TPA: hypothetical protein VEC93_08875 [Anaerolineae bacterium]|nr:hypothetical protein [Anaerolineae bacterium]
MRNDDLIKAFEHRARAAPDTVAYDEVLAEAKGLLNEEEYVTLLGHLQQPAEAEIIARALWLLQSDILPSVIPTKLIEEFGIGLEKAQALSSEAIKRHNAK